MNKNRRNFLKLAGLSSITMGGKGVFGAGFGRGDAQSHNSIREQLDKSSGSGNFNMSGYAAPKLDIVRTGFIGLGQRGPGHMMNMTRLSGVEIKAICDIRPEYADRAKNRLKDSGYSPDVYTGDAEAWKKLCDRSDIDLVFIATPWDLHTPMAVYAMKQGKHVCVEVPAAVTLDECWQLVETSEETRRHCMMMENDCYGVFELLTLNMTKQGFFGEIIHGEGAYIHNLLGLNFNKNGYWQMWRLKQNIDRNGNLYPTHGLGPICQIMNINRGDRMLSITSTSGRDFMMNRKAEELAGGDSFFKPFTNKNYSGNINTSIIQTHMGRTILVQHDVTSPNVYSRIHKVVGTKGTAIQFPLPGRISNGGERWLSDDDMRGLQNQYRAPIVTRVGELAKKVGGHGGNDFLMDWRTIDCLRNGLPLDEDVYDAALWSSVSPLTEWSVSNNAHSIDVPDFTRGAWEFNKPVDISLRGGGNTEVKL